MALDSIRMISPNTPRVLLIGLLVVGSLFAWVSISRTTYGDAVESFGVTPSDCDTDMEGIVSSTLERAPIGSSLEVVTDVLTVWGFTETFEWIRDGRHFRIYPNSVEAFQPYSDPPWSLLRFVCDSPGISVTLRFEDSALSTVRASTARACI
jgi:hypothetical protein